MHCGLAWLTGACTELQGHATGILSLFKHILKLHLETGAHRLEDVHEEQGQRLLVEPMPLLHNESAVARTPADAQHLNMQIHSSEEQENIQLSCLPVQAEGQPQDGVLGTVQQEEDDGRGNLTVRVPADVRIQEQRDRLRAVPQPGQVAARQLRELQPLVEDPRDEREPPARSAPCLGPGAL